MRIRGVERLPTAGRKRAGYCGRFSGLGSRRCGYQVILPPPPSHDDAFRAAVGARGTPLSRRDPNVFRHGALVRVSQAETAAEPVQGTVAGWYVNTPEVILRLPDGHELKIPGALLEPVQ